MIVLICQTQSISLSSVGVNICINYIFEISDYVCEVKFKNHFINQLFSKKYIKLWKFKIQFTKMILSQYSMLHHTKN